MSECDETVVLFGMPFSNMDVERVCAAVDQRIQERKPGFMATPNVNLVCSFHRNDEFREAYGKAFLWLPDGQPLMWVARLLGLRLREKLSGSDMVPILTAHAASRGHRVFFFGGLPDAAEIAAQRMCQRYPNLIVAGCYCPPYGFEKDPVENAKAIAAIRDSQADMCWVALGSPKQELWLARHLEEINVPACMGVGASLDFLSGKVRRAPRWMQQAGLEWLWRLLQEPRRLWRRYLLDDLIIIPIFLREISQSRKRKEPEGRENA